MPSWSTGISLAGADGLSVLTGSGVPASNLGVVNQAYIDITNAVLYRKTASGWPATGVSLIGPASTTPGPKGDSGQAGSVIYSSSGSPPDATGVKGDYFYSSDLFIFYGPKPTATSWSNATQSNLKGVKGDVGPQSTTPGPAGFSVQSGSGAPSNTLGNVSDIYVDTTNGVLYAAKTANGYPTPGKSLVGPASTVAGPAGSVIYSASGAPPDGTGIKGDYFYSSDLFIFYGPKPTATSWSGATQSNLKGVKGDAGVGTAGADGKTIRSGTAAPTNVTANVGDFYIQTSTPYTIYGPATAANTFPATGVSLVGPKGDTGASSTSSTVGSDGLTFADNTKQTTAYPGPVALSTNAPTQGPTAWSNGTNLTATAVNMPATGTTTLQSFIPATSSAFYYVGVVNFSNSAANINVQLYNNTDATAVWTTPNSIAPGTVTKFGPFAINTYPMTANKQYIWRMSGNGASYISVVPMYYLPSSAPFATQVPPVAMLTQPTTLSSTAVACKLPGTTNLTQYYQWPTGGYFSYAVFNNFSTATAAVFTLVGSATIYTSPSVPAGGSVTVGPFGPATAPLVANTQYTWQVTGSGSATVAVNWQMVG